MLLKGYELDATIIPLYLSTETALRNKTMYEPYTNLLRATTESMSAIVGGTDEHTVHPHDVIFNNPTSDSTRISLNIQHLLREESQFDKVVDVSAGSYLIEKLTQELTVNAWNLFLELEEKGGFVDSLRAGIIQEKISASRTSIEKNIRTRKRILVGVSGYAQPSENVTMNAVFERDPLRKLPEIKPVETFREAAVFESLRRTFTLESAPKAFLARFGKTARSEVRASFSEDFLAICGFISEKGNIEDPLIEQVHSEAAKKAMIIVLCAADEDYAEAIDTLQSSGWPTKPVLIAGKLPDAEALQKKGIHDFIYIGCDAGALFLKLADQLFEMNE